MNKLLHPWTLAFSVAVAAVLLVVVAAQARDASPSGSGSGSLVALRKTALGPILVDAHGRTLYLFEKDRNGASMCDSACANYWPALGSRGVPRAAKGVHQSLLGLAHASRGTRQVTYAGHPLYRFVGDKRAGQVTGEGLDDFGAEWYAVGAGGHTVERSTGGNSGSSGNGTYGNGGY